ncbi:MAG: hypothetical protein P8Y45_22075 [Exilibacterium sp.]
MMERMLEAARKDYWQTDAATLQTLAKRYTEMVQKYDLFVDNDKLVEFVNNSAAGFGLQATLTTTPSVSENATANSQTEIVEGQKLEQVRPEVVTKEWNRQLIWSLILGLLIMCGGFLWQNRNRSGQVLRPCNPTSVNR